mmetsp:Transcript_14836/g.20948  ORF Transcript_14836/g.20948 Transcript_14836/m.20948 type:complete len:245 (-) Transcript_14836:83-817(-)
MTTKKSNLLRGKFRNVFGHNRKPRRNNSEVQLQRGTISLSDPQTNFKTTLVSAHLDSELFNQDASDIGNKSVISEESTEGMMDRYYMYAEEDDDNERIEITSEGTAHGSAQYHIGNEWDENSLIMKPDHMPGKNRQVEVSFSGLSELTANETSHQRGSLDQRSPPAHYQACCQVISSDEDYESEESSVATLEVLMAHLKCGNSSIDVAVEDWDIPKCQSEKCLIVSDEVGPGFEGINVVSAYGD